MYRDERLLYISKSLTPHFIGSIRLSETRKIMFKGKLEYCLVMVCEGESGLKSQTQNKAQ